MSINVILRGRIYEVLGYAIHTRSILFSLNKANVNIKLTPLRSSSKSRLKNPSQIYEVISNQNKQLFRLLQRNKINRNYFFLEVCPPDYWKRDKKANKNIGFTAFETDAIPNSWKKILNTFKDEIWVPSKFNQDSFRRCGIKVPIYVIPYGFDIKAYQPDVEPFNLLNNHYFNFLSIFNWNPRKDWKKLLLAFCSEFRKEKNIRLVLLIHDFPFNKVKNIKKIRYYLKKINYNKNENVLILYKIIPQDVLPRLYTACQAFVLPSRGEGWCRPYSEALLCGLPVIYSRCSAMLYNLNEKIAFPIEGKMVKVRETIKQEPELLDNWIVKEKFLDGEHQWFENDIDSLRLQMRYVYENYQKAKNKAMLGRQWIVKNYNLDKVGKIIIDRLSDV